MDNGLPEVGQLSAEWLDFFIVFGAIGLVALLTFLWALFFRKNNKRKRKSHRRHRRQNNPTLAEIGGLPPAREENKPPGRTPPSQP
jgi:FtsZ-interacting cell division protein ZipA